MLVQSNPSENSEGRWLPLSSPEMKGPEPQRGTETVQSLPQLCCLDPPSKSRKGPCPLTLSERKAEDGPDSPDLGSCCLARKPAIAVSDHASLLLLWTSTTPLLSLPCALFPWFPRWAFSASHSDGWSRGLCCVLHPRESWGSTDSLCRAALEARVGCVPRRAGSAFLAAEVLALDLAAILFHGSFCCSPFPPTPSLPTALLPPLPLSSKPAECYHLLPLEGKKKVCVGEEAGSSR